MTKYLLSILLLVIAIPSFAHGEIVQEGEQVGKTLLESVSGGTSDCTTLTDDQFGEIGEFFMRRMMGDAHESMNTTMRQMLGQEGEEQMHMTMGKRMSGCETGTVSGTTWNGMMGGMMPMMMQGGGMMGNALGGFGFGFGAILMFAFWILLVVLLVGLVRWVWKKGDGKK